MNRNTFRMLPSLAILLILFQSHAWSETSNEIVSAAIHLSDKSHLALGEVTFTYIPHSYRYQKKTTENQNYWQVEIKGKEENLYSMYPVITDKKGHENTLLFRIPKKWLKEKCDIKTDFSLRLISESRYGRKFPKDFKDIPLTEDSVLFEEKAKEWQENFKKFLLTSIDDNEDHEVELLQYLRWFGEMPDKSTSKYSWKRDSLSRFFFTLSGLNDIRDAIPMDIKAEASQGERTESPPEAIILPLVNSP
ncbi:MAG: hypothetical protein HQL32_16795, partial [Planctomycetes bacterium]|nr:hypothetical protein [Planctomycetota bacterium]